MRVLKVVATIAIVVTFGLPTDGTAQTAQESAEANALFVDAARTYAEANSTSGRERIDLLREVASTLGLISEQYPDTLPARRIEEGTLGSIDLATIEAAVGPQGYDTVPSDVVAAIELTAERACGETGFASCKPELSEALVDYIAVLAFDLDRASDIEQLSWLFSNPGQFSDNLTRVNAFNDLLEDSTFRDEFVDRVNRRVVSDMAKEATADLAFSLLTGVVSETLAQHYEAQGYDEAAEFTRTWMEPMVDISLLLQGTSSASTTGAGVGAAIIWTKNAYAFWQLGEKQYRADQSGATAEQQLERLAAEIDSYTRTLISGRLTGIAFEGSEGAPLTDSHAEVIKSVLERHYELQQYWLSSDDAVLFETFDAVLSLARAFYETLERIAEPTPLDAADGTGALPNDLQGEGLQPVSDGFLGPPTIPTTASAVEGLIGRWLHEDRLSGVETSNSGAPLCTIDGEGVAWRITAERIIFYESSCSFSSPLVAGQAMYDGTVICNGEGENWSEPVRLQRSGSDLTYEANGYTQELVSCILAEPDVANPTATNSADVWLDGRFDAPGGYDWLQVASRPSYGEALEFVQQSLVRDNLKIFLAENGLFAISMGPTIDFPWIRESVDALKEDGRIPRDAYYTRGVGYERQYASDQRQTLVEPVFRWAVVARRTEMYSTFNEGDTLQRVSTNEFLDAGTEVVIWGNSNDDCLIDGHENVLVACKDLRILQYQSSSTVSPVAGGDDIDTTSFIDQRPMQPTLFGGVRETSDGSLVVQLETATTETVVGLMRAFGALAQHTSTSYRDLSQFEAVRRMAEDEQNISAAESMFAGRKVIVESFAYPVDLGAYDFEQERFLVCGAAYTPRIRERRYSGNGGTMFLFPKFPAVNSNAHSGCKLWSTRTVQFTAREAGNFRRFGDPDLRFLDFFASVPISLAEALDTINRAGEMKMSYRCEMYFEAPGNPSFANGSNDASCNVLSATLIGNSLDGSSSYTLNYERLGNGFGAPQILDSR